MKGNCDMEYGTKASGASMGHNSGRGNRAVAEHIKGLHNGAGNSGNSVSSKIGPKSVKHPPGAPESVLKKPRRSISKPAGLMD